MCSTSIFAQQGSPLEGKDEILDNYKRYASDTIERIYQNAMIKELSYVNGREYKQYHYTHGSNPYLKSKNGVGIVYINGVSFEEKVLRYDIYQDRLVLIPLELNLTGNFIELEKSKIDSFDITIDNELFRLVNIRIADDIVQEFKSGYYEIPYSGKYRLLIKHGVALRKREGCDIYLYNKVFYLYKEGGYHQIKFKRAFLALFARSKKQLKKKCRSIGIPYKKMSVEQKVELIKYAESL
ncbi:MAG: hypothetical protein JEZ14_13355 [Marinilabiliaceae bacterium]|nr:hypothetical protein [Marinilabiliaceae bacterium]